MIVVRTLLRLSFLGGGTDFPDYYHEQGGVVISTAIDKYVYVIAKERFDEKIYVNYSQKEIIERVGDLRHELVREAMRITGVGFQSMNWWHASRKSPVDRSMFSTCLSGQLIRPLMSWTHLWRQPCSIGNLKFRWKKACCVSGFLSNRWTRKVGFDSASLLLAL